MTKEGICGNAQYKNVDEDGGENDDEAHAHLNSRQRRRARKAKSKRGQDKDDQEDESVVAEPEKPSEPPADNMDIDGIESKELEEDLDGPILVLRRLSAFESESHRYIIFSAVG